MSVSNWLEVVLFVILIAISTPLLGNYMYRVYKGGKAPGDRFFNPIEHGIYRISGIDPEGEQRWTGYALSLLAFSMFGGLLSYLVLRIQGHLFLNPDHFVGLTPGLSFNTSISFLTNSDWQSYGGESTMSQFSQMFALVVQQFLSAAVGMAVVVAFIRALTRNKQTTIGSFWVDCVRSTVRILLPIAFVFAIVFMSQGVIQNFNASKTVSTVTSQPADSTGHVAKSQTIPGGPVASQDSIEMLGDNGGGYFNVNAAHPYQNPNPVSNLLLYWLVVMIPFAFPWTFGKMVGSMRQGAVIFASMAILFMVPLIFIGAVEGTGNSKLPTQVSQSSTSNHAGGNLEGKDTRLGVGASTLGANSITATSAGANNSAHESYMPLSGGTVLTNILYGEVSPGGAGSGLFGKLILVILSVFIAGLMVGRTPEYLGKKIQASEMKLVAIYILIVPIAILIFAAIAIVMKTPVKSLSAAGPHGLTEMVYTYTSAANNNGSAFAGISANTQWFNSTLGLSMLIGRYLVIIPVLAVAGSLVRKQVVPETSGTFRTDTPIFAGLLVAVTVVLVGLVYFPVLALGPVVEQLSGHFHF